jgi:Kef-type K+ transport system membrane component KefB/mannitol/fructose-specific phosphotransferase system IIA component (Ntr-type)
MAMALGYALGPSLLVGSAFSSHTLLAYPIASRLGIVRNEAVTTTLGGTILTEVLALFLLAVVANSAGGRMDAAFWARLLLPFAVYVAVVLWGLPRVGRWFFRHVRREGGTEFIFVMAALFTVSYLSHAAGVEPIIGALLAGLALNRLIPEQGPLMNRIQFVGNALFIPFFLLSVGMLVDVRALQSVHSWTIALALAGGVLATKWLAAWIAARVFGWTPDEGWTAFGLTVPHAAGTLAIVLVGYNLKLLDQAEVNGVIVMILATCLAGPWAVQRFGRRVALREQQRPYEPGRAPRRILVPLANPATAGALMELAFLLRGKGSEEPLHPLMVVPGEAEATEAEVAEAERMLSHAVLHAAAAEVPTVPLTRVDANVASGIARGAAETRSSVIVAGWDGRRSTARTVFGTTVDQLLEATRQLVIVAKLGHPLNVTRRVVVVLPPAAEHHPGFAEAAGTLNAMASQLGASLRVMAVGRDTAGAREAYARIRPQLAASWENVPAWGALLPALRAQLRADDLVAVLSARRGTVHWHPRLERLPARLAVLLPESFLVVYPPEEDGASLAAAETAGSLLETLPPERVVALDGTRWETALGRMLQAALPDPQAVRLLAGALVRAEQEFSSEIAPGVIVPHIRVAGLPQPVLVMGTSREGIVFPRAREPVRLAFLLVSPADRPEEHLRHLAEIARLLSVPARAVERLERLAPGTSLDWLHTADA